MIGAALRRADERNAPHGVNASNPGKWTNWRSEDMVEETGGVLWMVINVLFVLTLGGALVYGTMMWRNYKKASVQGGRTRPGYARSLCQRPGELRRKDRKSLKNLDLTGLLPVFIRPGFLPRMSGHPARAPACFRGYLPCHGVAI